MVDTTTDTAVVIRVPAWIAGRLRRLASQDGSTMSALVNQGLTLRWHLQQAGHQAVPSPLVPPKRDSGTTLIKLHLGTMEGYRLKCLADTLGIARGAVIAEALQLYTTTRVAPAPVRGLNQDGRSLQGERGADEIPIVILDDDLAA